jgi:hypothetical protein
MQFLLILQYIVDDMQNIRNNVQLHKICEPDFNMQNMHPHLADVQIKTGKDTFYFRTVHNSIIVILAHNLM